MPRPVSRRFDKFLKVFLEIATDKEQPTPLRLRAAELGLAVRSGVWEIAAGNKVATRSVRSIIAADAIDRELLTLMKELQRETGRLARSLETEEERTARQIDELLVRAETERNENQNNANHN